jgi:hypothetical protein
VAAVEASFPDLAVEKFRRSTPGASAQVVTLCGGCHGPQGRPVDVDNPATTIRFQALILTWSKCYEMSRETHDCLTCHSAHGDLDETPGFYEPKCLSCHTVETRTPEGQSQAASSGSDLPRRVACPVNPSLDCLQPTRSRNMETDMTSPRISDRTRSVLEKLPDEKRTRAEAIIAPTQTPEARASDAADRAILDREYRETGRIVTLSEKLDPEDVAAFRTLIVDHGSSMVQVMTDLQFCIFVHFRLPPPVHGASGSRAPARGLPRNLVEPPVLA